MEKAEPPKGNMTDRVTANINRCMLILLCASDHLEKVDEWGGEKKEKDNGQEVFSKFVHFLLFSCVEKIPSFYGRKYECTPRLL